MSQHADEPTVFRYTPPRLDRPKAAVKLVLTADLVAVVQVLQRGGENNLHSHAHLEGFWFVLHGHARFYTTGDEVIADLAPHEGVLIPRGYPYWFEAVGDEPLELLQVECRDLPEAGQAAFFDDRTNYEPEKPATIRARRVGFASRH